jgi:hypothetical protein
LHRWVPHLTVSSSSVEGFTAKNLLLAFSRPLDELMHPPSVHPVLKPSKLVPLCLELKYCRMNHYLYFGSSGAEDSSLGTSLSYSNWLSDRPTTPTDDLQFIWRYWFLRDDCCFSFWVHSTHLENGSSVHPTVPFCCFLCVLYLPSLELNIPSLIASKYILTLNFAMHMLTCAWYVKFV